MKTFVKHYVGKGKKVEGLEIIKLTLNIDELVKFSHKFNDGNYVNIEIALMKKADKFDRDHTAYVNRLEESEESATEQAPSTSGKKSRKPKKEKAENEESAPF